MAFALGVLMLLPGACSLVYMTGFGPKQSLTLMFSAFSGQDEGGYGALALLIWGGSFVLAAIGIILIRTGKTRRA